MSPVCAGRGQQQTWRGWLSGWRRLWSAWRRRAKALAGVERHLPKVRPKAPPRAVPPAVQSWHRAHSGRAGEALGLRLLPCEDKNSVAAALPQLRAEPPAGGRCSPGGVAACGMLLVIPVLWFLPHSSGSVRAGLRCHSGRAGGRVHEDQQRSRRGCADTRKDSCSSSALEVLPVLRAGRAKLAVRVCIPLALYPRIFRIPEDAKQTPR